MCLGFISQHPPNKVAPSFNLLSTNFLNTSGLNLSARVPYLSVGYPLYFESDSSALFSGIFLNALTLNPKGNFWLINLGIARFTISGETHAAIIPQQL